MTEQEKIRINELVFKSLEGTISQEECRELESCVSGDDVRVKYYAKCINLCLGLPKLQQIISDPLGMTTYLKEMAEYERTAEIVPLQRHILQAETPNPSSQKVTAIQKPGRFSLYLAIVSMAALILMLLYINFIPRPRSIEIATVVDMINARWQDPAAAEKIGSRLWTNQGPVILKEGIIAIQYDDGVNVLIQAPAEYELITPTEIAVNYGRVCAKVSEAGKGFTVKTRNSRIIDLGTEFGVLADIQGDTQLHVFNGKTMLIAGGQKSQKQVLEVPAGHAMSVGDTDTKEIELKKTAFARVINSQTGMVWNGQGYIDLANIVAGGDGLGGNSANHTLDTDDIYKHPILTPREFMPVRGNLFVDGIFVPNGAQGPVPVAGDGSILWDAPATEVRQKIGLIRFDIGNIKGDRSGAMVGFNVSSWEGKKLNVTVYGLKDGQSDFWDESQVCYDNAPGFTAAPLGTYSLNPQQVENLGVVSLDGLGIKTSLLSSLNLDAFIGDDTNGLLTLILICSSGDPGDDWKMTTKEGDPLKAPKLILPYMTGQAPVEITTAHGRGADTYLSNDNQYSSTGPNGCHGTEGVIKIRDYSRDPVYISCGPAVQYVENNILKTKILTEEAGVDVSGSSIIGMKAIAGMTFDLRKIRSYYPDQVSIKSFTALCGISETTAKSPKAGFYVLVDGRPRFSKLDMTADNEPAAIEVKLGDEDSYLTLVVTEGTDKKSSRDWGFFARPQLNIEN